MPMLERPGGAQIHWEERGEGPLVVLARQFVSYEGAFEELIELLAAEHRVVFYDLRGNGSSTRHGQYDLETDAEDLGALIEEAGPPAVIVGHSDGCNRAVKLAAARPDLVRAVVTPGGNPVGRKGLGGTEGLAGSDSVVELMLEQFRNDYRGVLRTLGADLNPQMSEEEVRERVDAIVAYTPHEAALARVTDFIEDESRSEALSLGDRLWILWHDDNAWFPASGIPRTRELLPDAHVEAVAGGPISRPDITVEVVRQITARVDAPAEAS